MNKSGSHGIEVRRTLVAALVGSVVALVLSPISQSLSFVLNEYLARPVLAVEYVEVVPEDAPTSIPTSEIKDFLQLGEARTLLMSGNRQIASLMSFQDRDSCGPGELQSLRASVTLLAKTVQARNTDLPRFQKVLDTQPTDRQIRDVAQRFSPQTAMMFATASDTKFIRNGLLPQLNAELATIKDALLGIHRLQTHLAALPASTTGKIRLKVSVVNRGGSDGLVRNTGQLIVMPDSLQIHLRRSNGPETLQPTAQPALMGVPVNVLNPAPIEPRATSLGRVEKHSYAEFWFEVADTSGATDVRDRLWKAFHESALATSGLGLMDHENKPIMRSFPPTPIPRNSM